MINLNKRWLLKASPWMQRNPRLSPKMIVGGLLALVLMVCGQAVTAAPITGITTACVGTTTTLTAPVTGGTWSTSNTALATIGASGVVTGVASGIVTTYYRSTKYVK